jgi:hypothetical protein
VCQISNLKSKKCKSFEMICEKSYVSNKQINKQTNKQTTTPEPVRTTVSQTICDGSQKVSTL